MGRLVGVAAAPARDRFGDAVEGVKRHDRGQQGVAAVKRDHCRPAFVRLDVDDQRRRAERSEAIKRVEESRTRGVRGREGEDWKSWAE